MYEPSLRMWASLDTMCDPASHTIRAVAPHFSTFAKRVVNGRFPLTADIPGIRTLVGAAGLATDPGAALAHVVWDKVTGRVSLLAHWAKVLADKL